MNWSLYFFLSFKEKMEGVFFRVDELPGKTLWVHQGKEGSGAA